MLVIRSSPATMFTTSRERARVPTSLPDKNFQRGELVAPIARHDLDKTGSPPCPSIIVTP